MSDQGLNEAFNDCLNRINAGQSINDCLRRYPQYAAALRPMLEVGKLVERAQVSPFEVATAQARVRARMTERLQAKPKPRQSYTRWVALAASLMITLAAVIGMAESSLPGDPLYGLKRLTEDVRGIVIGDNFAARRLDEVRVLLALRRVADVTFSGEIERVDVFEWTVAGLNLRVAAGTPGADSAALGDQVRVEAATTEQGELIARSITLLERGELLPRPTETAIATLIPSLTSTAIPTIAPSSTPTMTATPTFTPIPPSVTPSPTFTPTSTSTVCVVTQPAGWVRYIVQSGDTVAMLANVTGTSTEQLIAVNCLPPTLMIIVGQALFLPMQPSALAPTQPPSTAFPTAAPVTDDDHGGDDEPEDDDDGSENSGSGSENSGSGSSGDD